MDSSPIITKSIKISNRLPYFTDQDQFDSQNSSNKQISTQQLISQSTENSISNQINIQPNFQQNISQDMQKNQQIGEQKINNQDESIPENIFDVKMGIKKKYTYSLEQELNLSMRLRYNKIYMNKDQSQVIPGIVSIKANDYQKEINLQPIDIIFVVDESGSMDGTPIELVKQTLLKVLSLMNKNDRICIIGFENVAKLHLNLTSTSVQNKDQIAQVINKMKAGGGTSISAGMQKAFEIMKNRTYKNEVASIFLLSDGQDSEGYLKTKQFLESAKIDEPFSIDCFGYGSGHDAKLMTNICNLKQGTFNFVQDIQQIEFAFSTIFAGIISAVAQSISIVVKFGNTAIMNGLKVKKTYGDQWIKLEHQLMAGASKDFVFEICIPQFEMQLPDQMRFQQIAIAQVKAKCLNSKQEIKKFFSQTIELLHNKFNNEQIDEDGEVMENYYRVIASNAMKEGQDLADKGNYKQGQNLIQGTIDKMNLSKYSKNQNIQELMGDLRQCQNAFKQSNYNSFGQGYVLNMQQNIHQQQNACAFTHQATNMQRVQKYSNNAQCILQNKIIRGNSKNKKYNNY